MLEVQITNSNEVVNGKKPKTLEELISEQHRIHWEAHLDEACGNRVNGATMGKSSSDAWQLLMSYVSRRGGREIYDALIGAEFAAQERIRRENNIF